MRDIVKDDLEELLADPQVKLIDARPSAAYNGWRLQGEARGGHIPGAVAFSAAWAKQVQTGTLKGELIEKKLTPGQELVVYGDNAEDSATLVEHLSTLGYRNVANYRGGFPEWAADDRLPVDRLELHEQLVYPQWLRDLLDGGAVAGEPRSDYAVFHVNYGVPDEYGQGHIPGAFYLDSNTLESSTDWNRRSPEELKSALFEMGITRDTTVIVYGRDTAADPGEQKPGRTAGQIAATRAAAILFYCGVRDVRLLDGGYNAWVAAGFEVETIPRTPNAGQAFGADIPAQPECFIDLDEAKEFLENPNSVLVSVRSWAEHIGETSGYNYIGDTGDIPGAVWGNCGTSAYDMQHYRNVDNTMRDFKEIRSNWEEVGITPDKNVAFYCGTGWRASEAFFYAYLMGWPRVAVYDGGWFEWSRQMNRSGGTPGG